MHYFSVTSLCPILIWVVLVFFFLSICLAIHDGIARLKRLHQIPCSRCTFFTGSYYLKCTVHPCKALSEEAIHCLEYEPRIIRQCNYPQRESTLQKNRFLFLQFLKVIPIRLAQKLTGLTHLPRKTNSWTIFGGAERPRKSSKCVSPD